MFRKMKGITIAEMMITLGIIGIIAMLALITIKPYDKTYKWLYVRIYHTLETAVYNSMMSRNEFPQTTTAFCTMLTEYMNVSENYCTTGNDLSINATEFPENDIKLVASNGMRLWIASNGGTYYTHTNTQVDGAPANMKYYVVFADLNGSKGPNKAQWTDAGNLGWTSDSKMVDIVAFVVTEASVVIPVGPPEIDTRYMLASAIYPPDDENRPEGTRSKPMSYYEAKYDAFGSSKSLAEPMSLDFYKDFATNSPFAITYPTPGSANVAEGCTDGGNMVSPCYVKIEEYN